MSEDDTSKKPNFWQVVLSTAGAAFGVQSKKNQERDFQHGSIYTYIAAGIIFTAVFVAVVATVVSTVLSNSGV